MVLIVDYLSTSQSAISAPSTTISRPLSLLSPQTWLKKWLQRKIVQNADCDDEADMQIGPGHNVGRCEEARGEVVKEGF